MLRLPMTAMLVAVVVSQEEARKRQAELDRQLAEARREEGLRLQKEFQEVVAQEKSKGGSGDGKVRLA